MGVERVEGGCQADGAFCVGEGLVVCMVGGVV